MKPIGLLELDDPDKPSGARLLRGAVVWLGRAVPGRLRGLGSFLNHLRRPRGAGVGSGWLLFASILSLSDGSGSRGGRIGFCVK